MITHTSLTLLESLRGGSVPAAWGELFRRYAPMLLGFARRNGLSGADAQDAVQEVLIAVHREFSHLTGPFDRSKGSFKAWLRGIARHKVQDIRRRANRGSPGGQAAVENAAADHSMDQAFEDEWRQALLIDCLDEVARQVDPAVYQAFELYAVHGQSPAAVARLLGVSKNAVYISKTRVLKVARLVFADRLKEEA